MVREHFGTVNISFRVEHDTPRALLRLLNNFVRLQGGCNDSVEISPRKMSFSTAVSPL